MNNDESSIPFVVHETAKGLRDAGVMDEKTMREFDALCLPHMSKTSVIRLESGPKNQVPQPSNY